MRTKHGYSPFSIKWFTPYIKNVYTMYTLNRVCILRILTSVCFVFLRYFRTCISSTRPNIFCIPVCGKTRSVTAHTDIDFISTHILIGFAISGLIRLFFLCCALFQDMHKLDEAEPVFRETLRLKTEALGAWYPVSNIT